MNIDQLNELKQIQDFLKSKIQKVENISESQDHQFKTMRLKEYPDDVVELNANLLAAANSFKNCMRKLINVEL